MKFYLPKTRRFRIYIYILSFLLILGAADLILANYWRTIHLGPDTTRISGPLRADGTVDYLAAVNEASRRGVTAENNAAPLLLEAVGPKRMGLPDYAKEVTYRKLGITPLPAEGKYFVQWQTYAKAHPAEMATSRPTDTDKEIDAEYDAMTKAGPWRATDHPREAAWLAANEHALNVLGKAVELPRYYIPRCEGKDSGDMTLLIATLLPGLGAYRDLSYATVARAMLRLGEGNAAGAWEDVWKVHQLARLVGQGPTLMEGLVAVSIESEACKGDQAIARSGNFTAEQWRKMAADVAGLSALPSILARIDETERYTLLDFVKYSSQVGALQAARTMGYLALDTGESAIGRARAPFVVIPLHYDAILRSCNEWYDRYAAVSKMATYRERKEAIAVIERDLEQINKPAGWQRVVSPTNLLFKSMLPSFGFAQELWERGQGERDLTVVTLGLAGYKARHGEYPETLEALAPDCLPTVPQDLFAAAPLHYRRTGKGYLLYSVGPDMLDHGGKADPKHPTAWRKGFDRVIEVQE